jgi:hypothetical protein
MGEIKNAYKIVAYLKVRDHSEDLGIYGNIKLKWMLGKDSWRMCITLKDGSQQCNCNMAEHA